MESVNSRSLREAIEAGDLGKYECLVNRRELYLNFINYTARKLDFSMEFSEEDFIRECQRLYGTEEDISCGKQL